MAARKSVTGDAAAPRSRRNVRSRTRSRSREKSQIREPNRESIRKMTKRNSHSRSLSEKITNKKAQDSLIKKKKKSSKKSEEIEEELTVDNGKNSGAEDLYGSMISVISDQRIQGDWKISDRLLTVLKMKRVDINKILTDYFKGKSIDDIFTAIIVTWLKIKCLAFSNVWLVIVKKAENYLSNKGFVGSFVEELQGFIRI
jgi:hypothetical protein